MDNLPEPHVDKWPDWFNAVLASAAATLLWVVLYCLKQYFWG